MKDKVPGKKKKTKRTKETIRGTRKEVCDVCRTKNKSGHVRCELCGQWKHVKCVGKTFTELKKEGYKCPRCTLQELKVKVIDVELRAKYFFLPSFNLLHEDMLLIFYKAGNK